jgi:hypothetical protein
MGKAGSLTKMGRNTWLKYAQVVGRARKNLPFGF